ncbi:MAG: site-specific DNA-methyltransferase [Verrucomicrobia bacterium]|nr:site-specific DNA-methyltransferase [Verrucomicrobiota bacterium]
MLTADQSGLLLDFVDRSKRITTSQFAGELVRFREFGKDTRLLTTAFQAPNGDACAVDTFVNEFWTAQQRQANRLHEISYRACFKPQLPRFFIERLTDSGSAVYDPFMGRGTTPVEAALLGRVPVACDINPLSVVLTRPRLHPPRLTEVAERLKEISLGDPDEFPEDLLVFYHPETLREISALKKYLLQRRSAGSLDAVDEWICMVAINRLTGHSNGFFSVYTLPPNQATSVKAQQRINTKRNQTPPRRHVREIILKKSRILLSECDPHVRQTLARVADHAQLLTQPAASTPQLASNSVHLAVTSPPFLDVVDYAGDNWLRCWFLGIDAKSVPITKLKNLEDWQAAMTAVFRELRRVLVPGGHLAFEVGEVRGGTIKLEEAVLPCGVRAGLQPVLVLINDQEFTKTANCWGVDNGFKGTNTNRIVLFRKE